jgi:hypothetical protein
MGGVAMKKKCLHKQRREPMNQKKNNDCHRVTTYVMNIVMGMDNDEPVSLTTFNVHPSHRKKVFGVTTFPFLIYLSSNNSVDAVGITARGGCASGAEPTTSALSQFDLQVFPNEQMSNCGSRGRLLAG